MNNSEIVIALENFINHKDSKIFKLRSFITELLINGKYDETQIAAFKQILEGIDND